jgi:hypothetical protein
MRAESVDPLTAAEIVRASHLFCEAWYDSTYPDVAAAGMDPALHYVLYGARLGRRPGPAFDSRLYALRHPESLQSNPLLHFLLTGGPAPEGVLESADAGHGASDPISAAREETAPDPMRAHFDAAFYREQGAEIPEGTDPFRHYTTIGWRLGLAPNRWFDPIGHAALHKQMAVRGMNPFAHYLRHGLPNGASANPYFDDRFYRRVDLDRPGTHEYGPEPLVLRFHAPEASPPVDPGTICVHAHAFYVGMLGDLRAALARIPLPFTLLVSLPEGQDAAAARDFLEAGPGRPARTVVRTLPNRGRDVAPWIVDFRDEIIASDVFLHLHTKQSSHAGDHHYWFRYLCHSILGSSDMIAQILTLFAEDRSVGLVAPLYWPMLRRQPSFGKAKPEFDRLLARIGAKETHMLCPDYPAGSFFWCRTRMLEPLLRTGLTREDFPEERGQICGTLAHAVERAIGALPAKAGLRTVFVTPDLPHERVEQQPVEIYLAPGELIFDAPVRVSVIVPTWNRRETIEKALDTAFEQSTRPAEVIVVDDGSTDGTAAFLRRRFRQQIAEGSLKLIVRPHEGVSAARNAGLEAATGDIITYLDSDNIWRRDYLAHLITAFVRYPNALSAYADLVIRDADRNCVETLGRSYDRAVLLQRNFIDLNVFSHRRNIDRQRFDLGLTRLVDWEFILNVTRQRAPLHIRYVGADYYLDRARLGNITYTAPLQENMTRVRRKHRRERVFHGCEPMSFAIKCPAPARDAGRAWGDLYFATSLCNALERLGCRTRIDLHDTWDQEEGPDDDVVVVLRGLSAYRPRPHHINFMWHISHPDKVRLDEMQKYDHVFVASYRETQALHGKLGTKVSTLLQCSDPDLFHAAPPRPNTPAHDLLFVGNSRGVDRWMPRTCVEQNLPVTVYGRGWEDRLPKEVVAGSSVRNELLSDYYRAAKIVLNDHWPDMARRGFISNRIFDAGLSGTLVISDDFEGKEIFFGSVLTCRDGAELEEKTRFFLAREEARRTLAGRLRHIVALSHTFDHRAQTLLRIARRTAAFRLGLPAGLATTTIDRPVEAPPGSDASAKPRA